MRGVDAGQGWPSVAKARGQQCDVICCCGPIIYGADTPVALLGSLARTWSLDCVMGLLFLGMGSLKTR